MGSFSRININVEGHGRVAEIFQKVAKQFDPRLVQDVLLPAARVVRDEAKRRVPVGAGRKPSGEPRPHLRDAIYAGKGKQGLLNVIVGIDYKQTPHAHLVEFGTKPHTIAPRSPRKLLWVLGKLVPFVRHPGAKKKPFLRPAVRASQAQVLRLIGIGCKRLLDKGIS